MENKAKEITLVPLEKIIPAERNPNQHPQDQINILCEVIKYQGFRSPLIISNRSGRLVSGHGRLLAAQRLGLKEVPCIYQDYESDEQEYASMINENSLATWSELDLAMINIDLELIGPMDIELLGIQDFVVDPSEFESNKEESKKGAKEKKCPSCGATV